MSVKAMTAVWESSRHGGSALLMMLAIADFADHKGVAYPAVSTLATKTRMRPRNAQYLLTELQKSGELVIKVNAGPRGTNLYRIALEPLQGVQAVAGGVQASAGGVQRLAGVHPSARGDAIQRPKGVQPIAPEPLFNRHEPSEIHPRAKSGTRLDCPQDLIRQLYGEMLPELPGIKRWTPGREKALRLRWSERAKELDWKTADEGVAWFRKFFETVSRSDFLMGRVERHNGHAGWVCDVDFLLKPERFTKIIEGGYASHRPDAT